MVSKQEERTTKQIVLRMHGRTECSYPGEFKCLTNKCIIAYGDQMVVNSGPDWETHAMNIWSSTTACGGFYFKGGGSFFSTREKSIQECNRGAANKFNNEERTIIKLNQNRQSAHLHCSEGGQSCYHRKEVKRIWSRQISKPQCSASFHWWDLLNHVWYLK